MSNQTPFQSRMWLVIAVSTLFAFGCTAPTKQNARNAKAEEQAIRRGLEAIVQAEERSVSGFERRLGELGAMIRPGARTHDRIATYIIPGKPGYFPPREVQVTYMVMPLGLLALGNVAVLDINTPWK